MRIKRLLVLSLIFTTACKPPTPAEQMQSALSWIGTAGMAGNAWLRHTTPDTYTRQILELAHEKLGQISDDLLKSPPLGRASAPLNAVLARSRRRIARMEVLITAKNAPDFARQLDSLRADQRLVKRISNRIEPNQ
jgi:hypothetical protein